MVRRPSFEGATVFPLWHTSPFRSRPLFHCHLCPFLLSEGERGTFSLGGGGGLARVCHSVMDDSTPTRSIRLPRACTCLGGESHPRLRALSLGSVANRAASDRSSGKANFFVGGGRVSSVDEERTIFQRTLFVDRGKEKERKRKIGKKLRRGNITGAKERERGKRPL